MNGRRPSLLSGLALLVSVQLCAGTSALGQNVTQFHNDLARSGAYVVPGLNYKTAALMAPSVGYKPVQISGSVAVQPLYWQPASGHPQIITATMNANIYALDAITGAVVWEQSLGTPFTHSNATCLTSRSDTAMGIFGTPAIDSNGILYVNASLQNGNSAQHEIYALNLANGGAVVPGWPVAPGALISGFQDQLLSQHSAVLVFQGQAYFTYGSIWGDCKTFEGLVVAVNTSNPEQVTSFSPLAPFRGKTNSSAAGAGIWGESGVISDGTNIYVASGNAKNANGIYSGGDSIFRLQPNLSFSGKSADYFAPASFAALDKGDLDLGSGGPNLVPVEGGKTYLFAAGKAGVAYLVPQNLGGVGGSNTSVQIVDNPGEITVAPAILTTPKGTYVVVSTDGSVAPQGALGCPAGSPVGSTVETLFVTPGPHVQVVWCAAVPYGAGAGSPIITTSDGASNPIAWVIGATGDNNLYGFNLATGQQLVKRYVGGPTLSRVTPIVAGGRMYIASPGSKIFSFSW